MAEPGRMQWPQPDISPNGLAEGLAPSQYEREQAGAKKGKASRLQYLRWDTRGAVSALAPAIGIKPSTVGVNEQREVWGLYDREI